MGKSDADDAERGVDEEHLQFHGVLVLDEALGHGGALVEAGNEADDDELNPADQDLAAFLLPSDRVTHPVRDVFRSPSVEQPVAKTAQHQAFSSQRLVAIASAGWGRRPAAEAARRSPIRRVAQTLENRGR